MSYLVLHIDMEFIVGTVCTDNGTSSPVTNGREELLWLYFFNNPHQNSITYGKDNKTHFNNSEVNYYGKFFEKIEKEQETFLLRGIEHPVIDLLKESGLLDNIRKTYQQRTLDNTENVPVLLTFSSSISDNAKQKMVDYLKNQDFQVDSYTIPLSELVSYHVLSNKALKVGNGSVSLFLEATNSTLHLMKLSLSDNYFLMDGKPVSWRGKGIDPRKRALVRFVVNEVNKATGVLSTEDEKEDECERLEMQADEWLKRLDAQTRNMPCNIQSVSFSKMPNTKKDVLVRKNDLDSDTGAYTQDLKDIFEVFRNDNVRGDVAAVFLLGNCFQSDRVKTSFEQMIGADRLYFYANRDIQDILEMYPKIDINRYASEEARIREHAKAEELKQAEQRALEDRKRKEREKYEKEEEKRKTEEKNRQEAKRLFDNAVELEKNGMLEDARVNVENAIAKDKTNKEYKQFFDDLKEKTKKLKDKNELYMKYLSNGDNLLKNGDLEKALEEYEAAKFVFDNAEIIQKIIEVKRFIQNKKKQEEHITQLIADVKELVQQQDFQKAKAKIDEILSIDKTNAEANSLLVKIDQTLKLRKQQENKEKCDEIIRKADALFDSEKCANAKAKYEEALKLCPDDKVIQSKIKQCEDKIKAQEDVYSDLLLEASVAERKGDLSKALISLEKALKIKPEDINIKSRIKKIKFDLEFEQDDSTSTHPKSLKKTDDDDFIKKGNKSTKKDEEDDFLGISKNQKTSDNEIKKKKNDFDNW
jgi:hypothetical protein